jgi:hypothetical protein
MSAASRAILEATKSEKSNFGILDNISKGVQRS